MNNDASLHEAYSGLATDQILEIRALSFAETLTLAQSNPVTLSGGHVCDFSSNPGYTTVQGMTFSGGSVTIENFVAH